MRPEEWIRVAEDLVRNEPQQEPEWRSAIHASYYVVYHLAARHFGLDPSGPHARHEDIRGLLKALRPSVQTPRFIALARQFMPSLWRLRVIADYRLDDPLSGYDADQAVGYAQRVVQAYAGTTRA